MGSETRAEFVLSGFGDEISADLTAQLDTLAEENIFHLELRSIWGKNVLDLSPREVDTALKLLDARGVSVSAIASPIGKVPIQTEFAGYLPRFERALEMARLFGTGYVRIFSFYVPAGGAERFRDEVVNRLSRLAERAEAAGVVLLHENEKDIYGETPERCADMLYRVGSPSLRLAFDPANFVQAGVRPMVDAYPLLKDYLAYVHVKDAVFSDGAIRLPGEGDGDIPRLVEVLRDRGYRGFLSLEPHQVLAGRNSGFSGPGPFRQAAQALKKILGSRENFDREGEQGATRNLH